MRTILCVVFVSLFASTASAQFAKNAAALRNKPANADAQKVADGAAVPADLAGGAPAGDGNSKGLFAALDVDGDGTISKTELRKAIVSLKKLDTDNDGSLTLAECGAGAVAAGNAAQGANNDQTQWVERILAEDKNKDGKITPNELTENEKQMLQAADQNRDGEIDRQELTAFATNGNALNGAVGAVNGLGGTFGRRGGNEAMAGFFQYDRNRDGKLTPDEVPPQSMGLLKGGDRNGDGAIDASEFQATAERMGDRIKGFAKGGIDPNGNKVGGGRKQ